MWMWVFKKSTSKFPPEVWVLDLFWQVSQWMWRQAGPLCPSLKSCGYHTLKLYIQKHLESESTLKARWDHNMEGLGAVEPTGTHGSKAKDAETPWPHVTLGNPSTIYLGHFSMAPSLGAPVTQSHWNHRGNPLVSVSWKQHHSVRISTCVSVDGNSHCQRQWLYNT